MTLRSLLYVPAHSERFIGKAHERGADAIILDLEDAVPDADKTAARDNLAATIALVARNGAAAFVRINAGARANGLTYSELMNGIKLSGIALDRKVLADIAARDPASFTAIVDQARSALKAA